MSWTGSETRRKRQRELESRNRNLEPRYRDPIAPAPQADPRPINAKLPRERHSLAPGTPCLVKRTSESDDAWRKHVTTKRLSFRGHHSMERDTITFVDGDWMLRVERRQLLGTPTKVWSKRNRRRRK